MMPSIWTRLCRTTSTSWQTRFQRLLHDFDIAGADGAQSTAACASVEDYFAWSRRSSGFAMGLALIEYAAGIDLPDEVVAHPAIRALEEAANSHISWSNVRPDAPSLDL